MKFGIFSILKSLSIRFVPANFVKNCEAEICCGTVLNFIDSGVNVEVLDVLCHYKDVNYLSK